MLGYIEDRVQQYQVFMTHIATLYGQAIFDSLVLLLLDLHARTLLAAYVFSVNTPSLSGPRRSLFACLFVAPRSDKQGHACRIRHLEAAHSFAEGSRTPSHLSMDSELLMCFNCRCREGLQYSICKKHIERITYINRVGR